jgi:predicted MFS family arabinose efflux permease
LAIRNQAPIEGWSEVYVYVCLIIGVLFVPVFFFIELRLAKHPLIPFDALTADTSFVLAAVGCGWGGFGVWFFYAWSYFLNLRHSSPLLASAQLSPVCPSGAIAAICTGILLGKLRPGVVMTIAMLAFTVGTILIMTAPLDQIYWAQPFLSAVVTPWGMDMSFPAATLILSNAVKKEHQGVAASLVNTVVNYSISLGLGFGGTVEIYVNNGGHTPQDILKGYRGAWYVGCGITSLGLAISIIFLARDHWRDRNAPPISDAEEQKA